MPKLNKDLLKQIIMEELYLYHEGLMVTHNIHKSIDILKRWTVWYKDTNIEFVDDDNKIIAKIADITLKEFEQLLKIINNLGYYISQYTEHPREYYNKYSYNRVVNLIKNNIFFELIIEAKYDKQLNNNDIPDKAYHVTDSKNEEKILKLGLVPKNREKKSKHPERVYFTYNIEWAEMLSKDPQFQIEQEATIFEINFKELLLIRSIRLFNDANLSEVGFYTYENIPPKYLKIVRRIKI